MSDHQQPPPRTADDLFEFMLCVSRGDEPTKHDLCAALREGVYAMQDRARADRTARGRTVPPTLPEIEAHRKHRGAWIVSWDTPVIVSRPAEVRRLAARFAKYNTPARWIPIDLGGVAVEWPVAASEGPPRCECGRAIPGGCR